MAKEAGTTEAEIKAGVERVVGGRRINVWTVGVCENLDLRREAHGRPTIWHYWEPASEEIAKNVEAHFRTQGMKGYTGESTGKATYVYITW